MQSSRITHKPVIIFTWNPEWATLKTLELSQRIELFKEFIARSQHEFSIHQNARNAICLMIAPDLVFSLGSATALHTYDDFISFSTQMDSLKAMLTPASLVIAGAIDYVDISGDYYKVTAPIISNQMTLFYDKKASAGNQKHAGKTLAMLPGQLDGYFEFQGLPIGLEICQDHQMRTLQKTLQRLAKTVSLQILISNGQCRRDFAVISPTSNNKNIFVHVELEPGAMNQEGRTLESQNYEVELKCAAPSTYHQTFLNSKLKPLKLTPILSMPIPSSGIRYCTVSIAQSSARPSSSTLNLMVDSPLSSNSPRFPLFRKQSSNDSPMSLVSESASPISCSPLSTEIKTPSEEKDSLLPPSPATPVTIVKNPYAIKYMRRLKITANQPMFPGDAVIIPLYFK
jgi:hypothetical protein